MTSVPHPLRRDGLRLLLPGALLATALALGACGSTSSTAAGAPPRSTPPTTVPAATTTPPPTSAPATTTTPSAPSTPDATPAPAPGSPDRYPICTAPTIAYGGVTSFVGHFGAVITVKSNDTSPCVLAAYPDVAGLDASGRQVTVATETPCGFLYVRAGCRKPQDVVVRPGQYASAMVEDTVLSANQNCPVYRALAVTEAAVWMQTTTIVLPAKDWTGLLNGQVGMPGCGQLEVHPLVVGVSLAASS